MGFVTHLKDCILKRCGQLTVVEEVCADHIAVEEVRDFLQRTSSDVGVSHLQRHSVWFGMWIFFLSLVELFFLFLEIGASDVADGDGGTDDAEHSERISTGVTVSNLWCFTGSKYRVECFVGGTESRCVGHGTVEGTHHHRQVDAVARVEENVIAGKHHQHVEKHCGRGQKVKCHTAFLKALEEAWTHLQTDAEHKEDQSEILQEGKNRGRGCEADVAGDDAGEQNIGDTQRDAANLDFSQQHAHGDHQGIEQRDMCHAVLGCEKID